jgi:hypothetical protein
MLIRIIKNVLLLIKKELSLLNLFLTEFLNTNTFTLLT